MNWFLLTNGVLLLGGSFWSFGSADYKFAVIYFCWAIPSFILGWRG